MVAALRALWRAAGYPWSVRLKALLPVWLPKARAQLHLTPAVEKQVRQISPRQMDRLLAADKREVRRRLYGRTKPGTLLKHHIPLRTDRWDVTTPGWTEVDLVAHSGDRADGEFAHTVNQTDIVTTWVESRAVLGKSQVRVQQALEAMRQGLPFRLLGIDSVMCPVDRRTAAWAHLAEEIDRAHLDAITHEIPLAGAIEAGRQILSGTIRGRLVVDVNR